VKHVAVILALSASAVAEVPAPAAKVTGRVLLGSDLTAELIGYYTQIEGLPGQLFAGEPSEKTAYFAFRTDRAPVQAVKEGDSIKLVPRASDSLLNIYFHPLPNRDFSKPDTFAEAQLVATYRTTGGEATLSAEGRFSYSGKLALESSADFVIDGARYNFRDFGAGFVLSAGGSGPNFDEIARQAAQGSLSIPFTGSASVGIEATAAKRSPPQPDSRAR
jgi:hypothetical protein